MKGVIFALFAINLSACGGGGGGGETSEESTQQPQSQAEPTIQACLPAKGLAGGTAKMAGFYRGLLTISGGSIGQDVTALVAPNGKIRIAGKDNYISGALTNSYYSAITGDIDIWEILSNKTRYEAIAGTFTPGVSLKAYNAPGVISTLPNFSLDLQYGVPKVITCLENSSVSDTWTNASSSPTNVTTITIDDNHNLTGSTTSACVITGSLSGFNVEGGIFAANVNYQNCSKSENDGAYSGLGSLIALDSQSANKIILFIDKSDNVQVLALSR